ncbi:MAG: HEPN domain-containing protein [candidate division WOR-3 bacterium]
MKEEKETKIVIGIAKTNEVLDYCKREKCIVDIYDLAYQKYSEVKEGDSAIIYDMRNDKLLYGFQVKSLPRKTDRPFEYKNKYGNIIKFDLEISLELIEKEIKEISNAQKILKEAGVTFDEKGNPESRIYKGEIAEKISEKIKTSKTVCILSVGNEEEKDWIEEALNVYEIRNKKIRKIFIIWSGEKNMEIRHLIKEKVGEKNLKEWNVNDPFSLEECIKISRKVKEEAIKELPNQVIVNFGSGSKILSLSLFYVTFEEFWEREDGSNIPLEVYYTYKDGEKYRNRECSQFMWDDTIEFILGSLSNYHYGRARMLAEELPEKGDWGFIKYITYRLCDWHEFLYKKTWQKNIERFHCETIEEKYPKLGKTWRNLKEIGNEITKTLDILNKLEKGEEKEFPSLEQMKLLIADFLENISRRMKNGEYNEVVFLSYRVGEMAIQTKLLSHRINPWKEKEDKRKYHFWDGFDKINKLENNKYKDIENEINNLANLRNELIITHGFLTREEKHAQDAINYAEKICKILLGIDDREMKELRSKVRHEIDEK